MIVGIGELLWDIFPDGRKVAGGAPFNFAFHCQQLGHDAGVVSRVGDDDLGRELREEVRRLGMSDEFIQTDHEHPTGTVRVTVDEKGQPTYAIGENVAWDHIAEESRLVVLAGFAKAVCFGTLGLRGYSDTVWRFIGDATTALRVFDVNLRDERFPLDIYYRLSARANWIKLNDREATSLAHTLNLSFVDSSTAARSLVRRLMYETLVIVTRGDQGCELVGSEFGERSFFVPGVPARVVDTVGAGDAFTAAMVCLHLEGQPLCECARFANHYAARVCEHRGATPRIDRAEVEMAAFGSPS
jgi:fructokinase